MIMERRPASLRLMLILAFAVAVPGILLVLFGFRSVRNERYVLEHKIAQDYREAAGLLGLSVEERLRNFETAVRPGFESGERPSPGHPLLERAFELGSGGRVIFPARLPGRRSLPAAQEPAPPDELVRALALEGRDDRAGAFAAYARLAFRPGPDDRERLQALSGALRNAAAAGDPATGLRAAQQLSRSFSRSLLPGAVSPKILAGLSLARMYGELDDKQRRIDVLQECFRYMISDTADIFQEEMDYYPGRILKELASAGLPPRELSTLESGLSARLETLRLIRVIERVSESRLLPDSGYFYRDSSLFCLFRGFAGTRWCAQVRMPELAEWIREFAARKPRLSFALHAPDGWPVLSSAADDGGVPIMVSEPLCRRLAFLTLTLSESRPGEIQRLLRLNRLFYGLFLALLVAVLGAGLFLAFASVRREWEVARLRSNFISGVSHELKTPLTSIQMLSEMLSTGRVPDERKKQEYYNLITRESARLTGLINKILDFSRIDEGKIRYEFESHDLDGLFDEALFALSALMDERDVQVTRRRAAEPVRALCDRKMIVQVMVNLMDNAVKYSPARPELELSVRAGEGAALFSVRDRGIGIAEGEAERIFEEFYRSDRDEVRAVKGTGLGLAIVRRIVREHDGSVAAVRAEGGGLSVTVRLPPAPAALPAFHTRGGSS